MPELPEPKEEDASLPGAVVHDGQAQSHGQEREEPVVAGHADDDLQEHQARARGQSPLAPSRRREQQPRQHQLHEEHARGGGLVDPDRQVVHIPGRPQRQRLRLIVVCERGEIGPRRVAAGELGDAGQKHQTKEQPPDQPAGHRRRRRLGGEAGSPPGRCVETGQQSRLEQQRVPLEGEKRLSSNGQGQIADPQHPEDHPGADTGDEQARQHDAGGAEGCEREVARREPQQAGVVGVGRGSKGVEQSVEVVGRG